MSELGEPEKESIRQTDIYKVNKEILDYYLTKITKLSSKVGPAPPSEFVYATGYEAFKKNCSDFSERWNEAKKVSQILRDLKTFDGLVGIPSELLAMNKMLVYLGLVESLGVALADMVLILLMANEKEIHSRGPMTKHIQKVDELDKIDLGYKLDFLKGEELSLFTEFINSDVRNNIAHLKFSIQKNGEIRKRDGSPIHIDKDILKFWHGVKTLTLVFEDIGFLKWFDGELGYKESEVKEEKE